MNLKNNTILITGGSSGIGLELARHLSEHNKVVICGRSKKKLQKAKKAIPKLHIIQCDLAKRGDCEALVETIKSQYPDCNVAINNAAVVHNTSFRTDDNILQKAELEINTNYRAPVILTKLLLPVLEENPNPHIIYVTTGLVYAPKAAYPFYNSTKAALHSFIQTLRLQLKPSKIKIIEVLMTVVDTPFHQGKTPKIAISVEKAVDEMLKGVKKGSEEIRIASVKILYILARIAPSFAFKKINTL